MEALGWLICIRDDTTRQRAYITSIGMKSVIMKNHVNQLEERDRDAPVLSSVSPISSTRFDFPGGSCRALDA